MRKQILVIVLALLTSAAMAQQPDPVILTVAGEEIQKSEFERVFKKNNTKENNYSLKDVQEYMQLYINYKLKVKEALEMKMDTVANFRQELTGYRKQLAQPYLIDKSVSENLVVEAYDRLKQDVRASHILIKCANDALPKDTLEAYNKAMKIRADLVKGSDFGVLAKAKSDDPSAKENNGDLGYFTAMQMVYPFENAVYTTKVGELTNPVRTRFGYHIIKVTDKRAAQGEVKVAHIMIKSAAGAKAEDSTKAALTINEIYEKLVKGENFEDLARQFSEDQGSAKNGGALPLFGTGRMVPEFETAAFSLKNINDFSKPVKTSYGFHIIKLLEKKDLSPYADMQAELRQKVQKDSRADLSKSTKINSIKKEGNFTENKASQGLFIKAADSSLVQGKFTAESVSKLANSVMFTLGGTEFKGGMFASYVESHQAKRNTGEPQALMLALYNEFVNESVLGFEEARLEQKYPDFKALIQEYKDGILLFELTDQKVWSKAVKDSAGLANYYASNKNNYLWPDRVEATVYNCANAQVAKEVKKLMKSVDDVDTLMARINQSSKLNLQVKTGKFSKGENESIDQVEWKQGMSKDIVNGEKISFVNISKVLPSAPKTIEEAKGVITSDYQAYLEKEWITSLKSKYQYKINDQVLESLVNKK
ncbi:MAG: hypothetical protein RIQ89_974 [Bacteroidota bacterium]|jgi:peptidyl-prolyl cis-trans isomerase SurA